MNLVAPADLGRIDAHLDGVLGRLLPAPDDARDRATGLPGLSRLIRQFVLAGGKRVRPQLCLWTYENASAGDRPTHRAPSAVLDVACAWELFHAFLLAHDDIIDSAEARRGRPSLHRQLASLDGDSLRFGANLGIVAGDLLCCASARLLHELDEREVTAETHRRLLRLFSHVACLTGLGQAIDICQSHAALGDVCEDTLLREYHWKTATYTFEGPMLSGAILAGAGKEAQAAVSRFALALGQAYQLQNDLNDLGRRVHEGCDLIQGKRTVTLLRARAAMDPTGRRRFDTRLDRLRDEAAAATGTGDTAGGVDCRVLRRAEVIRRRLWDGGAAARTAELIDDFLSSALHAAGDPALPPALSGGMANLLASLRSRYFARRRPAEAAR